MAHLRLVKPAHKPSAAGERPYATYYYASVKDQADDFLRQGHAKSEEGAIRAAVVRVFLGQAQCATICENGVVIYTVVRQRTTLTVHYGRAVGTKLHHG